MLERPALGITFPQGVELKMNKILIPVVVSLSLLSGCVGNSAVKRNETKQFYQIFQFSYDNERDEIIDILDESLAYNVNDIKSERLIPDGETPAKSGRFKLVNLFAGSPMAALAGASAKIVSCEGPGLAYKATVTKEVGSDVRKMTACLWKYEGGYHLDFYTAIDKANKSFAASIASSIVGSALWTSEEWANAKAFDAIVKIESKLGISTKLKTSYPKLKGEPWKGDYKGKGLNG